MKKGERGTEIDVFSIRTEDKCSAVREVRRRRMRWVYAFLWISLVSRPPDIIPRDGKVEANGVPWLHSCE